MLRHDSRPHRLDRRRDCPHMQHGKEPPFGAALNRRRPGVGTASPNVARQVKDVNDALPYRRALECLFDGHRLRELGRAAVLALDGLAELIYGDINHIATPQQLDQPYNFDVVQSPPSPTSGRW